MSTLLFRIDLSPPLGGQDSLFVRRNKDRSLSYSLVGGASTPLSLNNLQMRQRLPTWHGQGEPLAPLLERIMAAIQSGVGVINDVETTPLEEEHCPDCDVMLLDDEQIYCHCCGRKL